MPGAALRQATSALDTGGYLDATVLRCRLADGDWQIGWFGQDGARHGRSHGPGRWGSKGHNRYDAHHKEGEPKIVRKCTLPLTAKGVVKLIVTEFAAFSTRKDK